MGLKDWLTARRFLLVSHDPYTEKKRRTRLLPIIVFMPFAALAAAIFWFEGRANKQEANAEETSEDAANAVAAPARKTDGDMASAEKTGARPSKTDGTGATDAAEAGQSDGAPKSAAAKTLQADPSKQQGERGSDEAALTARPDSGINAPSSVIRSPARENKSLAPKPDPIFLGPVADEDDGATVAATQPASQRDNTTPATNPDAEPLSVETLPEFEPTADPAPSSITDPSGNVPVSDIPVDDTGRTDDRTKAASTGTPRAVRKGRTTQTAKATDETADTTALPPDAIERADKVPNARPDQIDSAARRKPDEPDEPDEPDDEPDSAEAITPSVMTTEAAGAPRSAQVTPQSYERSVERDETPSPAYASLSPDMQLPPIGDPSPVMTGLAPITVPAEPSEPTEAVSTSLTVQPTPPTVARPAPTPPPPPSPADRIITGAPWVVQLLAVEDEAVLCEYWAELKERHPRLFGEAERTVARKDLGNGRIVFRLRAGAFETRDDAVAYCTALGQLGQDCFPVHRTD